MFKFGDCVDFSTLVGCLQEMIDVPLYVSLHSMSATLKCTPPSATLFRSAVVNAGYHISGSHANPLGLKTDAPMEVLWDIMRCWVCSQSLLKYVPVCMLLVYVGGLCIWFCLLILISARTEIFDVNFVNLCGFHLLSGGS